MLLAAAFVGFNFTTTMLLGRTAGGAMPGRATLPAALDLGALAPLLADDGAPGGAPRPLRVSRRRRSCRAASVARRLRRRCRQSPLARRIKRLFKKRGRGAKAAEPPKPACCREQLAL